MANTTGLPVLFATGIHASRPAASAVGSGGLYSCTTHSLVYQTDGSTWTTWATLGGSPSGSITASGYTQSTARLLGRTTGSTGAIEEITVGSGLSMAAGTLSASGGGGGAANSVEIIKKYTNDAQNTASWSKTITAAPTGRRLVVVFGSYGRAVNTPTCTNVTFTSIRTVSQGTGAYLAIFLGVVSGTSGTTLAVTATGSNWIIGAVYEITDTVTGTVVTSADLTSASAGGSAGTAIGPITPPIGSFFIVGCAQDNGGTGFSSPSINLASDSLTTKAAVAGGNDGMSSLIGRTGAASLFATYSGGTGGANLACTIVAIT